MHLRRVELDLPDGVKDSGSRALLVTLVAPRPTIAERSHSRMIALRNGVADLSVAPFHRSILFKETVQGPFGVHVALSDRGEPQQIEQWLRELADYALRAAGSYFSADVPTMLRSLVQRPFVMAGEKVTAAQRPVQAFATGGVTIESSARMELTEVSVPISVESATILTRPTSSPRRTSHPGARRAESKETVVVKKGTAVGKVVLAARIV